ncbi:hypothetical protein ACFYZE_28510 [Streptomyces sp. NPDC001796]
MSLARWANAWLTGHPLSAAQQAIDSDWTIRTARSAVLASTRR